MHLPEFARYRHGFIIFALNQADPRKEEEVLRQWLPLHGIDPSMLLVGEGVWRHMYEQCYVLPYPILPRLIPLLLAHNQQEVMAVLLNGTAFTLEQREHSYYAWKACTSTFHEVSPAVAQCSEGYTKINGRYYVAD